MMVKTNMASVSLVKDNMQLITAFQTVSPGLVQGVPNHLEGWEHEFEVPKQYSGSVMAALTTKKISSNVRAQISQDVATKMLIIASIQHQINMKSLHRKLSQLFLF